jgi:hypothetical protein
VTDQVTNFYVQQYTTNVELLVQQKDARIRSAVATGAHVGKAAVAVDQVGLVAAQLRTTRYPDLTPYNTPTDRRWVYPADYDFNDLVDKVDILRMLQNPESKITMAAVAAFKRTQDDILIAATFGTSQTGETGSTGVTFPATQQVAVSVGTASSTSGLTVAKLRAARKILLANEVDLDAEPAYCAISAAQHDNLLAETQAINLDYTETPVLESGRIKQFMGFDFIHSERLPVNASGYRRIPVWVKSGLYLGIWEDLTVDVSQRRDKAGLPWQVYVYLTMGATRTQEKKVVQIACAE